MTDEAKEDQLDPSLFIEETPQAGQPETPDEVTEPEPESDIPEKYRGKTAIEVIKMHQDAERLIGSQGNELGQLRQVADDLIAAIPAASPAPQEEEETDFFTDPNTAVTTAARRVLDNDPELKALKQNALVSQRERSAAMLLQRHPDAEQIAQDPKFGEWISKNEVRRKRMQAAHENYDSAAASEILDTWKEIRGTAKTTADNAKGNRSESVKNASTGSGKQSAEAVRKPILSRERLIELKSKNPDEYYAKMSTIEEAYREGRVR